MSLFSILETLAISKDKNDVLINTIQHLGFTSSESVREVVSKELFPEIERTSSVHDEQRVLLNTAGSHTIAVC